MDKRKWQGPGAKAPETVLVEQKAPLLKRLAGIAVVLVLGGVLLVWGVDLGRRILGASQGGPTVQEQLDLVQAELVRVTAERDALRAQLDNAGKTGAAPPSENKVLPENQKPEGK